MITQEEQETTNAASEPGPDPVVPVTDPPAEPQPETDPPPHPLPEIDPVPHPEPNVDPLPDPEPEPRAAAAADDPAGEKLEPEAQQEMGAQELLGGDVEEQASFESSEESDLRAVVEALIYVTEDPLTLDQIVSALEQPRERIVEVLDFLIAEGAKPERGLAIREVAGGYKMGTKPEHHDAIRTFVKKLKPPLKLSMAALETLAVVAYKQPITSPEIMDIRGVQGAGVLKTLLDRKLIAPAGRKNVVGKPVLYKTTKDFLVQFGLKDLAELPTLKEFEELRRLAFSDTEEVPPASEPEPQPKTEPDPAG
ncbi:MAG TPA: SMC-Scp complex subunit ScpB [Bryobacteraceae bacterium]|nr:SMC-Scp complex subunit ScpB [Bryobacteraceae bacterium]